VTLHIALSQAAAAASAQVGAGGGRGGWTWCWSILCERQVACVTSLSSSSSCDVQAAFVTRALVDRVACLCLFASDVCLCVSDVCLCASDVCCPSGLP